MRYMLHYLLLYVMYTVAVVFFFTDTATTEIYTYCHTLSLHDALPILAEVSTRTGTLEIVVEVTDTIMQGVVSIPHGWGHNLASTKLEIANQHAGTNANALLDERLFDAPSINSVLNGVPVRIRLEIGRAHV